MTLSTATGEVLTLTRHGRVTEALALSRRALLDSTSSSLTDQAAMWYAVSHAELVRGSTSGVISAAERCVTFAVEADCAGWASAGLAIQALALARQGRMEPALLDLGRAEAELLDCTDPGLCRLAHTRLGSSYLEMRLYELARPHLELAQQVTASPFPRPEDPVVDLMNLVGLHIRWADELERVHPDDGSDDEVESHRKQGHAFAERALDCALRIGDPVHVAACRVSELTSRPRGSSQASLQELRDVLTETGSTRLPSDRQPAQQSARAMLGGALARALWSTGRRQRAVEAAREAASDAAGTSDWQLVASAQWLVVEMEAQCGVPGAASGRAYAGLLSQVLWQQRLSTLQGAQAALTVERLHRDKETAQRAANEDALTGISNRRVLDDTIKALQADPHQHATGPHLPAESCLSLILIDLDDFKTINDTYGHVVGDEVLRAVAMALRGVARTDDVVARLGGDEFVVLARGADEAAGRRLADRVTTAIESLTVGSRSGAMTLRASVGLATVATGDEAALLLRRADDAMYADKRSGADARRLGLPRQLRPPALPD